MPRCPRCIVDTKERGRPEFSTRRDAASTLEAMKDAAVGDMGDFTRLGLRPNRPFWEAPGSSHLSLSAQNPDFGPKKCNNLGQKSAMRYKDHHVVTIIMCFWSKFFLNPQARGTISIQAVVKVRATNISFNHLPTRNLVPHLLQSFFGHLLSE